MKSKLVVCMAVAIGLIGLFAYTNSDKSPVLLNENGTITVSANIDGYPIYEKVVSVQLVDDGYMTCHISDSDWSEIEAFSQVLQERQERANQYIDEMFSGNPVMFLSAVSPWAQDESAEGSSDDGYLCYSQSVTYELKAGIPLPWQDREIDYEDPGFDDPMAYRSVILTGVQDRYYLTVQNTATHASLQISFDSEKLQTLARGIMLENQSLIDKASSPLPSIAKSLPIQNLETREVGSFVVAQEDFIARDIFVKLIEAILPLTTKQDSFAFVQSSNQKGNEINGGVEGSLDGGLMGLQMGGWGFVTGAIEGSLGGSIESQPVILIRGSIYTVPKK